MGIDMCVDRLEEMYKGKIINWDEEYSMLRGGDKIYSVSETIITPSEELQFEGEVRFFDNRKIFICTSNVSGKNGKSISLCYNGTFELSSHRKFQVDLNYVYSKKPENVEELEDDGENEETSNDESSQLKEYFKTNYKQFLAEYDSNSVNLPLLDPWNPGRVKYTKCETRDNIF